MIYVIRNENGEITGVASEYSPGLECRVDWKTFDQVTKIAADLTRVTKELYIPIDNGDHHYPRYDIIKAPKVGDEVSYAFNGDYYPCGKIVNISKTMFKITTDTGDKFYRRKNSGSWIKDGTWSLVQGHIYRQNPSF